MNREKIETLITALEHPENWNKFTWKFSGSFYERRYGAAGCALGLAHHIGLCPSPKTTYSLAKALDINQDIVLRICIPHEEPDTHKCAAYDDKTYDEITPQDVAAKFRQILNEELEEYELRR